WEALVTPELVKKYFFGTTVASEWKPGSPITWSGEWQGKRYQDKGKIVRAEPGRVLAFTHFSPLSGMPDVPENYHTVTIDLAEKAGKTTLSLAQDGNPSAEARAHTEANWKMVLDGLKKLLET